MTNAIESARKTHAEYNPTTDAGKDLFMRGPQLAAKRIYEALTIALEWGDRLQKAILANGIHHHACRRYQEGMYHTEEKDCNCWIGAALREDQ